MNRYSSTYKPNELSLDDLRAYQADQLSGPARHRVERLMLENPFYADAFDGLDALQQQVGGSLASQTRELHLALQERIQESATTRRLMPLWVTSLVVSVLLVLSVSIYLIINTAQRQKQAAQIELQAIEPGTVLIDPNDLGTFRTTINASKHQAGTLVARPVKQVKAARKKHRPDPVVAYEIEEITVMQNCGGPLDIAEEPLPETGDAPSIRHINPERAFTDWPPSAKTIPRW